MKVTVPMWLILAMLALVAVSAGGGVVGLLAFLSPPAVSTEPGTPGQRLTQLPSFFKQKSPGQPTEVAALGRLLPKDDILDIGGLTGDRVGKLDVHEGQTVERGDILGYLDSHAERQAERDANKAQVDEAKARLAAEKAYYDAMIKDAEAGVRQAKEFLPLDIKAQEARIELLKTEIETSQAQLDRLRSVEKGSIIAGTIEQQAQVVRRSQQDLVSAQAQLTKMKSEQGLSLERAEAKLDEAKAGRKRAEAMIPLESLTKNWALSEVRLERTILRAPRPGTVLKILTRPGERIETKPILKLADTREMYVVAEVYESDALQVKPGQRAKAISSALPQPLTGTVERVGQLIARNDVLHLDPAADADSRVVEVWIRLDPSESAARLTNLQVDVLITLASGSASSSDAP